MAITGVLTISAVNGRFNHRFVGGANSGPGTQLLGLSEWLAWCARFKHMPSVDSFLSFVHQFESGLCHQLTGVSPVFGGDVVEGMRGHYADFLSVGAVSHVWHVDVVGGRFGSVTHLERVRGRRRWGTWFWDAEVYKSPVEVHWGAVGVARMCDFVASSGGRVPVVVGVDGSQGSDFGVVASRHAGFAYALEHESLL